jgi:hypothetical protein
MFNNYIKEAISLNKLDLSNEIGVKLYYSRTKCLISTLVYLLLIIFCFSEIITNIKDNPTVMIFICLLLLFTYAMQEAFSKVLYKNPILILSKSKIFYLKTQKWYDISEHKFGDKYIGKGNFQLTFCMEDKNEKYIFQINNWHLDDHEYFKAKLRYNKKISLKSND